MLKNLLYLIAAIWLIVGVGSAIYLGFGLRPKVARAADQMQQTLSLVDQTRLSTAPVAALASSGRLSELLPGTLSTARDTLLQASNTLQSVSGTAKQVKKGITGLVLPKEKITANQANLNKTATELRRLAGKFGELSEASRPLAENGAEVAKLGPSITRILQSSRSRVDVVRASFQHVSLIFALAAVAVFGLCITLAVFSFALGRIYSRERELSAAQGIEPARRAA